MSTLSFVSGSVVLMVIFNNSFQQRGKKPKGLRLLTGFMMHVSYILSARLSSCSTGSFEF